MSHPPFAHNPHVYDGIDPESVVVTSRTVTGHEDTEPAEPVVESDEDSVDVDGDGQISGYEVFSKADLIGHIEMLNESRAEDAKLSTAGNKPDLVRRIQEADAADKAGAGE